MTVKYLTRRGSLLKDALIHHSMNSLKLENSLTAFSAVDQYHWGVLTQIVNQVKACVTNRGESVEAHWLVAACGCSEMRVDVHLRELERIKPDFCV